MKPAIRSRQIIIQGRHFNPDTFRQKVAKQILNNIYPAKKQDLIDTMNNIAPDFSKTSCRLAWAWLNPKAKGGKNAKF
ncbi:MAG: hypothetical protein PVF29_05345 [Desulfobacterales bacterium]|jgi:hypothetical protein